MSLTEVVQREFARMQHRAVWEMVSNFLSTQHAIHGEDMHDAVSIMATKIMAIVKKRGRTPENLSNIVVLDAEDMTIIHSHMV